VIGDKVIFGSNTSTLPITSLAEESKRPAQFIGVHFFSPFERMMLSRSSRRRKPAMPRSRSRSTMCAAIRKTPIVVNDSRGFYTSRVVGTYIREGHLMLTEGVPAAMIENVGRMAGMPVGPLSLNERGRGRSRLEDLEGDRGRSGAEGDRRQAEGAFAGNGGEARPARTQERQGFLTTTRRTARSACGPASPSCRRPSSIPTRSTSMNSSTGLLAIQALESARCVEEGVITDVREGDVGSILGFGFAPFSGGTLS